MAKAKSTSKKTAKKTTAKKTTKKAAKKATKKSVDKRSARGKSLVIVESHTKTKTIKKFLGGNYRVEASMGHVRDLASKGRGKERFGIDIENGYAPKYAPIKGREKTLDKLKELAAKAQDVYLAPDPDREGEAIAWHLAEVLLLPQDKINRITFNAITKSEVSKAIENPRSIDMNLVNAQQARRVLDRLVGFSLSPLLWKKVTKGLSAGRVQSVAVRMVVEREKEIRAFQPEEFWRLSAELSEVGSTVKKDLFLANLVSWKGESLPNASSLTEKDIRNWQKIEDLATEKAAQGDDFLARYAAHIREVITTEPTATDEADERHKLILRGLNKALQDDSLLKLEDASSWPAALKSDDRLREIMREEESLRGTPPPPAPSAAVEEDDEDEDEEEGGKKKKKKAKEPTPAEIHALSLGSLVVERNRRALDLLLGDVINQVPNRISTRVRMEEVTTALEDASWKVADLVEKENRRRASPPFITSTLQQAASTFLSSGTSKTMRTAQQLYEGVEIDGTPTGLITYMRTDSVRIAPEAIDSARQHITSNYNEKYLPEKPNFYKGKNSAQDAHEAIRPTDVNLTPERIKNMLSPDQFKLYDLIWRRFVSSQMTSAVYLNTTATITAGEGVFEAKGRKTLFDGYTKVWDYSQRAAKRRRKDEVDSEDFDAGDQFLPFIEKGDALDLHELLPQQVFTKPPARYSEASLVRALEAEGIGRPSTYAPIVRTIQERGYVRLERRSFVASELGIAVTELLMRGFPEIMDYRFTAGMEDNLDKVEEGNEDWVKVVDEFYRPFEAKLGEATDELEPLKGKPAPNGEKCPQCEAEMTLRYSRNGAFLSCSNYPECKGTRPLDSEGESDEDAPEVDCPQCNAPMVKKMSRFGPFMACSNYPECKQTMPLDRDGQIKELPKMDGDIDCDKCGKKMIVKSGRRGPFIACSGYPDCKNTMPISKEGKPVYLPKITGTCEKCNSEMVVKTGRRGPFLACTGYPKCRNAKPLPKDAKDGDHIDFAKLEKEKDKAGDDHEGAAEDKE